MKNFAVKNLLDVIFLVTLQQRAVGGDMSELNAHTYVYQPDKSLQGFTIEVKVLKWKIGLKQL